MPSFIDEKELLIVDFKEESAAKKFANGRPTVIRDGYSLTIAKGVKRKRTGKRVVVWPSVIYQWAVS